MAVIRDYSHKTKMILLQQDLHKTKFQLAVRKLNVIGSYAIVTQMLLVLGNCNSVSNLEIKYYCFLLPQSVILKLQYNKLQISMGSRTSDFCFDILRFMCHCSYPLLKNQL